MTCTPNTYRLPDLHATCAWKSEFNPHHAEVLQASIQWALSYAYDIVKAPERLRHFESGQSELLCSWVYPYAAADKLRLCFDLVNLVYIVDEASDDQDGDTARETVRIVLRAMTDPAYENDAPMCRMSRDFARRFLPHIKPATTRRFLQHMKDYLDATAREAELREEDLVADLDTYTRLRRNNSGVLYCFDMIEYILDFEVPDAMFNQAAFTKMHLAAADMVTYANDIYSYNREQAMGHANSNFVTVLRNERNLTLQEAADAIGQQVRALFHAYEEGFSQLCSTEEGVCDISRQYARALKAWVIGNVEWSFDSCRYFGDYGKDVRESLVVELRPMKVLPNAASE